MPIRTASDPPLTDLRHLLVSPWILPPALWLAIFWMLGDAPLYDLDEGAFAEATREMFERGNFIATYLNGEPRYDKPILIYWLQAAAVIPLGFNELALRLPSALAVSLWALALFSFGRRFLDRDSGVTAALLLIFSLMVFINARTCTADSLLNLFLTLAFLDIYRYHETPSRSLLLRVWLWLALGLLTKGPIALALPFLVSLIFYLRNGRGRDWLGAAFSPAGWGLFLLVTLPWLIAVAQVPDYHFFQGFLLEHNINRFTDTLHGHGGHLYYYFLVTPLILLPFSGWLLASLTHLRKDLKDPLGLYLWTWFLTVFVLFSVSHTQLPHYLLYGAPPLLLLMARHRERLHSRWLAFLPPMLFLLFLFFLPEVVQTASGRIDEIHLQEMLQRADLVFADGYRWWIGAALAGILILAVWRGLRPWQGLLATGFLFALALNGGLRPAFFELYQQPVKDAGLLARQLNRPVVAFETNQPSFSVYRNAVVPRRNPTGQELVFLRMDKFSDLQRRFPGADIQFLYRAGGFALLEAQKPWSSLEP